jgi:hypothetical protein
LHLPGVTELRGHVEWATADTTYIRVAGASTDAGEVVVTPRGLAAVPRQRDILVHRIDFSASRTAALTLSVAAVLGLALLVYFFTFNPAA